MAVLQPIEKKKGKGKATYYTILGLLIIGLPIQIFPFFWMLTNSFKTSKEIIKIPLTFLPQEWYLGGIAEVFTKFNLLNNMYNTVYICFFVILIQIVTSALAAFSLSKLNPKFGKYILLVFLGTMMISGQALMFPLYIMMAKLGLLNNKWSVILASSAWAYAIFLFKGFFDNLPNDLIESAKIDGAGSLRIFIQIIVPLSKPVFAVLILNTFMAVYNDFIMTMMLLPREENWTIMVRVFKAQLSSGTSMNNVYVLLTIATIPVIVIYLFAQKHISEGITMSGIKG